jgi:DNA-binding SARP family transcriptional activator
MGAGQFVHRDELLAALWPDDDLQSGLHNLQVAMSSLRRLLEPAAPRGQAALVVREGDSYRLTVDAGSDDIGRFERAVQLGRKASDAGDSVNAVSHLRQALATYAGDLLPEAGSAEWVVGPRERYRVVAGSTAQLLAECLLSLGEVDEAKAASERGLEIDRYRDGLWRTLIASCDRAEDRLSAARARHRYELVLTELEVPITSPAS